MYVFVPVNFCSFGDFVSYLSVISKQVFLGSVKKKCWYAPYLVIVTDQSSHFFGVSLSYAQKNKPVKI